MGPASRWLAIRQPVPGRFSLHIDALRRMLAKIHVTLKNGVLDSQGKAVHHALNDLGYSEVQDVHLGKYMEIALKGVSEKEAADPRHRNVRETAGQHGDRVLSIHAGACGMTLCSSPLGAPHKWGNYGKGNGSSTTPNPSFRRRGENQLRALPGPRRLS